LIRESHEAPSFIAINRTFREDVFRDLGNEPAAIIARLHQVQEEAEREMAERLKQDVNIDDA
jgi:hypothetical protein